MFRNQSTMTVSISSGKRPLAAGWGTRTTVPLLLTNVHPLVIINVPVGCKVCRDSFFARATDRFPVLFIAPCCHQRRRPESLSEMFPAGVQLPGREDRPHPRTHSIFEVP